MTKFGLGSLEPSPNGLQLQSILCRDLTIGLPFDEPFSQQPAIFPPESAKPTPQVHADFLPDQLLVGCVVAGDMTSVLQCARSGASASVTLKRTPSVPRNFHNATISPRDVLFELAEAGDADHTEEILANISPCLTRDRDDRPAESHQAGSKFLAEKITVLPGHGSLCRRQVVVDTENIALTAESGSEYLEGVRGRFLSREAEATLKQNLS